VAHKVKLAALSRVFGFEIMPAPFVVAHLQVGLYLQNLGAPLAEETPSRKGERAGVYLTNALTGWEPPRGPKKQLAFPQMEEERDAAEEVKRDKPILVILGNPPYNAFAGVSAAAEKILVEPYKEGLVKKWGIKKFNLDDLYVRFFGLAERRIAGMTGKGVVSYISNFSYLGDPSFVVMRQRFLAEFDALWFDCLNGDSRETGKLTPEGKPDPSVFSTEYNREGIRVGTAVCLMVRQEQRRGTPTARFRHFWGVTKRADLVESLKAQDFDSQYQTVTPDITNRFTFRHLAALGLPDLDSDFETAALIWMHVLAVGYAPSYLMENTEGIRQDWPRVPLPDTAEVLKNSAALGREVAALLDTETPAPGVTSGAIRPELKVLAVIAREGGGPLNPDAGDLALTAGWGYGGQRRRHHAGQGQSREAGLHPRGTKRHPGGRHRSGSHPGRTLKHLGESTFDIYLNETAFWQNVPAKVWNYYMATR
jgi:hypothetical protein